ncbi:MAG: tRNA (adenosine(37)-N6)-threonylcarbamoyltransferase complex dimerization subunit type 1 TsaB [Chitinophagaceae bacterium]
MKYILHINTALENAFVGITHEDVVLAERRNPVQMEHASFVQPAIKEMMDEFSIPWKDVKAVSVIIGPGSYTGLRVGLAAAKGICYAWNLPIIPISTLEWLAAPFENGPYDLIVPMIDARRMEVFTAIYSSKLEILKEPHALILDDQSYSEFILDQRKILFTGNGAVKLHTTISALQSISIAISHAGIKEQNILSRRKMNSKIYSDIAYLEPEYVKAFYSTAIK